MVYHWELNKFIVVNFSHQAIPAVTFRRGENFSDNSENCSTWVTEGIKKMEISIVGDGQGSLYLRSVQVLYKHVWWGGALTRNAYFAYEVRGDEGSRGKMLM